MVWAELVLTEEKSETNRTVWGVVSGQVDVAMQIAPPDIEGRVIGRVGLTLWPAVLFFGGLAVVGRLDNL